MYKPETKSNTTGPAFPLPGDDRLPPGITGLLSYLQANPAQSLAGDILFLQIKERYTLIQLLTLLPARNEIIAERPLVMTNGINIPADHGLFQREELVDYGLRHGIYLDGIWNINYILLDAARDLSLSLMKNLPQDIPFMTINDNQSDNPVISADKHEGHIFEKILMIHPQHFYIEKNSRDGAASFLEPIPFASENLVLDISRRYKIFSFPAAEYNLADDDHSLWFKIYKQSFKDSSWEIESNPLLVLEYKKDITPDDAIIDIYLNLPSHSLEIGFSGNSTMAAEADNMLQDWQRQRQIGYDKITDLPFIAPQLRADYQQHLEDDQQEVPDISKSVYYKALTLLNILCAKK